MPESEYLREYLQYGGQAVIEGVMMRSPRYFAIACRAPNKAIVVRCEPIAKTPKLRQRLLKIPVVRGTLALLDAITLGSRAMKFAANIQIDPQYGEDSDPEAQKVESNKALQSGAVSLTVMASVLIALFIFVYLPNLAAQHMHWAHVVTSIQQNLAAGLIKIVLFLGYIWGIGRMKEIHRIFEYHGAEHKAINTLEAGRDLSLGECGRSSRLHPRCGTSFAVIVLLVSLVIMTFVPRYPIPGLRGPVELLIRVGVEILFLPVIAGISYELLKFAGTFRSETVVMFFFRPGIWMQYLTTQEPTEDQIEVSLTALNEVLKAEKAAPAVK